MILPSMLFIFPYPLLLGGRSPCVVLFYLLLMPLVLVKNSLHPEMYGTLLFVAVAVMIASLFLQLWLLLSHSHGWFFPELQNCPGMLEG
jgi:hypothetical protein